LDNTQAMASTFTGTLLYMAPERISGGAYSFPADIWSFGLCLMACAIGKNPLPADDGYWGVVHAVQQLPAPKLSDFGAFSPELQDFLAQALHKDPRARARAEALLRHPFIAKNYAPRAAQPPPAGLSVAPSVAERVEDLVARVAGWHYKRLQKSVGAAGGSQEVDPSELNLPALSTMYGPASLPSALPRLLGPQRRGTVRCCAPVLILMLLTAVPRGCCRSLRVALRRSHHSTLKRFASQLGVSFEYVCHKFSMYSPGNSPRASTGGNPGAGAGAGAGGGGGGHHNLARGAGDAKQ
jgi:serine/threonine protein kinase